MARRVCVTLEAQSRKLRDWGSLAARAARRMCEVERDDIMSLQRPATGQRSPLAAVHAVEAAPAATVHAERPDSQQARARILIVENHPVYAAGLKALFSDDPSIEIIGHASNSDTALPLARFYQPDLILLDIGLGLENGLDLVSRFRRICPNVRIAIITAHEERDILMHALRLGVQAYIQKEMSGETIVSAVRQVLNGERVIPQASAMTAALTELGQMLQAREREQSQLSAQELNILRLAAEGLKNKDIGSHQFLSEVTIKRKLQDIYRKLSVTGKPAAVAEAMRLGLI